MSISSIKKALKNVFQGILKNLVSLADDSPLDSHLKPLKIGDKTTNIELSEDEVYYKGKELVSGDIEGTGIKSTGETGGTKFLREDGDGTCSWQTAGGGGTDSWNWQQSTRWYTRYGYQYHPNSTYGPAYYNWSSAYQSLPASWPDDRNPMIVIPKNMTIKSYHLFGNFSSAQTYELTLRTGTPSYGSAGDTSLSTIGEAASLVVGTANINQKIEQTGLSVSVSAGDIIIPFLRRTTNTTSSSYYFCEGVLSIVGEYS